MIDINSLRRLAQAATPGPWEFWHGMIATDIDNDGGVVIANRPTPSGGKLQARVDTNFQYIVAANPAAITELLDRLEEAEKEANKINGRMVEVKKRLQLIVEEPSNTMSNAKAMREMLRQANLALNEWRKK